MCIILGVIRLLKYLPMYKKMDDENAVFEKTNYRANDYIMYFMHNLQIILVSSSIGFR